MEQARTLVLGASHWHVPLYAERIAARHAVVGLSDPRPELVAPVADRWGAPVHTDWREMVAAHPEAELAYVFVPHDEMREACLALIANGTAVVVEKPVGTSQEDLVRVKEAARQAEVPVAVPLVQRGGPVDQWLAQAGGSVYEAVQFIAGPPSRYEVSSPWMLDASRSGGGCMVNLAPHFVDLFLQSAGRDQARVTAALSSRLHGTGVEDFASMTITTDDGRVATVETGYAFPSSPLKRHCSYLRVGPLGTATINTDGAASFTSVDGRTRTAVLDVDSDPLYPVFVDNVADLLGQGLVGLPTLDDLERAMALIWRAYEDGQRGESREQ